MSERVERIREFCDELRTASAEHRDDPNPDYRFMKRAADVIQDNAEALAATIARWEACHLAEHAYLETGCWPDSNEERAFDTAYRALKDHGDLPDEEG